MDILSKDTLKILSNESVRKGMEKALTPETNGSTVTVTVSKCDSNDKGESSSITIRRLSI